MIHLVNMLTMKLENPLIYMVVILIFADTLFGCGRAIKRHELNSSFGIDGAIRKVAMLSALVLCAAIDLIISIDLVPLMSDNVSGILSKYIYIDHLGMAEFFALLFILYEMVSVLKNMYLCGLPVKGVYNFTRKFLLKYTSELPDNDEVEMEEKRETYEDITN